MRKIFGFVIALALLALPSLAHAVNFELQGVKFGINGYVDLQYNYMSKLTQSDGMLMQEESTFKQEQLNLLFDAEKDRYRAHINFQSDETFSTNEDGGQKGDWTVLEAYGEYRFSDLFAVKAGSALTPFGIFNEVRYITPLFSSVVLPFIYQLPEGYMGSKMYPNNSNVVVSGNYLGDAVEANYNLYISNGKRDASGEDQNKDKGLGARVRLTFLDNYRIGASYYTVQNDKVNEGREHLWGLDVEANIKNLLLQAEYVRDNFQKKLDRISYYVRLTYKAGRFSPFVMYDHFSDPEDLVWKNRQNRYGIGLSYDVSSNVILKTEYHYHKFEDDVDLMPDTDTTHMLRAAAVFVF